MLGPLPYLSLTWGTRLSLGQASGAGEVGVKR